MVAALREAGLSVPEVAARFSLSQRTIFRILSRADSQAGAFNSHAR